MTRDISSVLVKHVRLNTTVHIRNILHSSHVLRQQTDQGTWYRQDGLVFHTHTNVSETINTTYLTLLALSVTVYVLKSSDKL